MQSRQIVRVGLLLPFSLRPQDAAALYNAAELALFDHGNQNTLLIPRDAGSDEVSASAAARALVTAGFPVTGWSNGPGAAEAGVRRLHGDAALWQALPQAQVLVNLLPLTDRTRGLLDARLFAALPRGAGVVNLARGAHVVDADLLAALASGQLSHAVLDVFHAEPLAAGHPFWSHDQVTVLPHVAAQTDARSAAAVAVANLRAARDGAQVAHRVDRDRGY